MKGKRVHVARAEAQAGYLIFGCLSILLVAVGIPWSIVHRKGDALDPVATGHWQSTQWKYLDRSGVVCGAVLKVNERPSYAVTMFNKEEEPYLTEVIDSV